MSAAYLDNAGALDWDDDGDADHAARLEESGYYDDVMDS
jgi:hypothetical protein